MKVALCSTAVPFIDGGARNIVDWLATMLREAGHEVEVFLLPQIESPEEQIHQMMAFRWLDIEAADRVICFRPQAHFIQHPHKILWFIHHVRVFYDMWESDYRHFPANGHNVGIREALIAADTAAIQESQAVFTNSKVVSQRLKDFNGIDSEVLYPPVWSPERYHNAGASDEIVMVCRLEHHKRPHLLIGALAHTKTPVKLRICGASGGPDYPKLLFDTAERLGVADRVVIENAWITEEEKVERLSGALATAYIPIDEDSYGYPSLEASHSSKAILTTTDSGGVLELVVDGLNGFVAEPDERSLARAMDRLYSDRENTARMGEAARQRVDDLGISWKRVLERMLA